MSIARRDRSDGSRGVWSALAALFALGVLTVAYLAHEVTWLGSALLHVPFALYGLFAVGIFCAIAMWVSGSLNPFLVVLGTDQRPSTSKFQFFFWTVVVVFGYVSYFAQRVIYWANQAHGPHAFPVYVNDFPQNVLIAMGFSVVTAAGAKGITVSYLNAKGGPITDSRVAARGPDDGTSNTADTQKLRGGIFSTDDGTPDLSKIQMLLWTFVAAIVFIYQVASADPQCIPTATTHCFPDIDGALMALMGLGSGAYLGNKIVSTGAAGAAGPDPKAVVPNQLPTVHPTTSRVPYERQFADQLCWAAAVRMVVRTLAKSNAMSQCQMAAKYVGFAAQRPGGPARSCLDVHGNCTCPITAPGCNYDLILDNLPHVYADFKITATSAGYEPSEADEAFIQSELKSGRPVQIVFDWSDSTEEHVAVIAGYNEIDHWYQVNDPHYGVIHVSFDEILKAYTWGTVGNFWSFRVEGQR